ncbi:MAG: alpha/beta hydrolase [Gemmatimonadales bacterium]
MIRKAELATLVMLLPSALSGQAGRQGTYVIKQGATEIARENYEFSGRRLTGELDVQVRGITLEYTAIYDSSLSPLSYHADVRTGGASEPVQQLDVTFGDSAAVWVIHATAGDTSGSTPLGKPYSLLQNLVFSQLAVQLLRYDHGAGGVQGWSTWVPEGNGVVLLDIEFSSPTEATVEAAQVRMTVTTDQSGWLEHIDIPSQGVTVVRLTDAAGDSSAAPAAKSSVDPLPPPTVRENDYVFQSDGLDLRGTLTLPAEVTLPLPVIVIVAGSGPTDRNGNSGAGLRTNMYGQLAWRLGERGIATLRYDKRGVGASGKGFDVAGTTFDDFVRDVAAAARTLRSDSRFSEVLLFGHSEGAGLVVRAVNSGAPVDGAVLAAGLGRPFLEVLRQQLADQFDAATMQRYDTAMAQYMRGEEPADVPPGMGALFHRVNLRFMQTVAEYAPRAEIRKVTVPVLIVQGAKDFQISVRDAEILADAKPDARLMIIRDANHVFKRVESLSRGSQASAYVDPTMPVVPQLIDAIVSWVAEIT